METRSEEEVMELVTLQGYLDIINGCTFASMDTITVPELRGGRNNPMVGKVLKECKNQRVILFTNKYQNGYQNMVRRRLDKEGKNPQEFHLSPRQWGERIPDSPLVKHTKGGRLYHYLEVIFLRPGEPKYYYDGKEIAKADVQGLVEASEAKNQGLSKENQVVVRDFKLDNITAIRLMGHNVSDATEAELAIRNIVCPELAL